MNTNNLKKVAPRARSAFIKAMVARAGEFGITAKGVSAPSVSGDVLQVAGFTHPARFAPAINRLQERVTSLGFAQLIEQMAYTWFNRFCAIRFMELKSEEGYLEHGVRLLSHPTQPLGFEVLDRAPEVIESLISEGINLNKPALLDLMLAGNEQEALFRELLLGQCHRLHQAMPFLFEAIDDETELLLPTGLTRTDAFWRELVDEIPEQDWAQVEVIGWLYQFYISEKKGEVIGKVVKSEDIPAATQLFTPNWIVQYLVQNSLGRYWLQTYPESSLAAEMPYYVATGEQPAEVLAQLAQLTPNSIEPESIKVLDPACGSGHILVEAYNILYRIYEERGYRSREIPQLILTHNLYGLDIDDRAAQLAGFALLMRARQDDRRLFSRELSLNIYALQESRALNIPKLWQALNLNADWNRGQVQDLFASEEVVSTPNTLAANDSRLGLLNDLHQRFLSAKTLGSLIEVPAEQATAIDELAATLHSLSLNGDTQQKPAARTLLPLLKQASVLAKRYDAVIANPPYMGSKGMNAELKEFAKKQFPDSKSDLFSMFIERGLHLVTEGSFSAMVTMESWMFLSSFEKFRIKLLDATTINSMVHMPYLGKGSTSMGINFGTTAFVIENRSRPHFAGQYSCVRYYETDEGGIPFEFPTKNERLSSASAADFGKIPGRPIGYWIRKFDVFSFPNAAEEWISGGRIKTHDGQKYIRFIWEVSRNNDNWKRFIKGGDFRKHFGNEDFLVNWSTNALSFYENHGGLYPKKFMAQEGICWSKITSGSQSFRIKRTFTEYDSASPTIFNKTFICDRYVLSFLNSKVSQFLLKAINPTINTQVADVMALPICRVDLGTQKSIKIAEDNLIDISSEDWNSCETSWEFSYLPILHPNNRRLALSASYQQLRLHWSEIALEMQRLEEENNRLFIDAYGLQDELTPEVPLSEITLTCNPHYRYGGNLTDDEREARLQSDTICELISYAIGCMMGRYSLDREGLVYAHAGNEGFKALVEEGAYTTFAADEDGILPLSAESWFADDVAARVEAFVRTVWGAEQFEENLQFIADSLCLSAIKPVKKGGETSRETLRRYLTTQFYKDHLKTYKKRPIYWLFSSGKEKAFECLVYLHRYNEATLPRMRTEYVTPLLGQIASRIERKRMEQTEASTSDAKRISKEIDSLTKQLAELRAFDDQLKHHADMRISLDLDDGVKVNYGKFGTLLSDVKAISGDKGE